MAGKQINFYMSNDIQNCFINYLKKENYIFFDNQCKQILQPESETIFGCYLYKVAYGKIHVNEENGMTLDSIKSPVIQFSKTVRKNEIKKIKGGRIWMVDKYYGPEGEEEKKNEQLLVDYKMLKRWIKKNVPYREIKMGNYIYKEFVDEEMLQLYEQGFILV